jgi:hypothetical protein
MRDGIFRRSPPPRIVTPNVELLVLNLKSFGDPEQPNAPVAVADCHRFF